MLETHYMLLDQNYEYSEMNTQLHTKDYITNDNH